MKTKHAVWLAFFLNLSYAIVEFIAEGFLDQAQSWLIPSMIWEMRLLLGFLPFWRAFQIVKKIATIPWATSALAFWGPW